MNAIGNNASRYLKKKCPMGRSGLQDGSAPVIHCSSSFSLGEVKKWDYHIVRTLFQRAKAINHVEEGATERELLQAALGREDAPISFQELRAWTTTLPAKFEPLAEWFGPLPTELVKNE